MTWIEVLAYLDDVNVLGKTFEDHLENLYEVLQRFRKYNLKLKPKKCELFKSKVDFLGRVVSRKGVTINPKNVEVVQKWPTPKCSKDVEKFMGFLNYHREFIPNFAFHAAPLYAVTGKKTFKWDDEQQQAYLKMKELMTTTPVLAYPASDGKFILDCDASGVTIAAVLSQIQEGEEKPVSYASVSLTPEQRKYCTTRQELLAVIRFTRQYRHYLLGKPFLVRTDHSSLAWLMRFKHIEGQLARWLEELSRYDITVLHRPGKKHQNADSLSRIPDDLETCNCYEAGKDLDSLPCGGCPYCRRAHRQWKRFEEDVDDVVPLAVKQQWTRTSVGPEVRVVKIDEPTDTESPWIMGYSIKDIKERQEKDPDLRPVIQWLSNDEEPTEAELFLQSKATKFYWLNKNLLSIKKKLLFYRWILPSGEESFLLVVPKGMKEEVLATSHDLPLTGHNGQLNTLRRIRKSFFWYGMKKASVQYVRTCRVCNRNKKRNRKYKAGLTPFHSGIPMERVHLDILGPFNISKRGNRYVLVMIDQFTKWVEVQALPHQGADLIAETAVNEFFSRMGCPLQIHTDQGKNFDGQLFRRLCEVLQIAKTRTTPYRPASNGQCERCNRTLLFMIRAYLEKTTEWDIYLQQIAGAIRSTVNDSTGETPNRMMLGRETLQPIDLLIPTKMTSEDTEPSDYVGKLEREMSNIHHTVRQSLKEKQYRQKKNYDVKSYSRSYDVGDLVYKVDDSTEIGVSKKLKPPWVGPYLIVEVLTPNLYRVQGRKERDVLHHDKLRICQDREIPLRMRQLRKKFLAGEPLQCEKDVWTENLGIEKLFENKEEQKSTSLPTSEKKAQTPSLQSTTSQQSTNLQTESLPPSPKLTRRGRTVNPPARFLD